MMRYFQTRAKQDAALKEFLLSMGNSTTPYSKDLIESIDSSDHEITVAIITHLVDVWIPSNGTVCLRVSDVGREWLAAH